MNTLKLFIAAFLLIPVSTVFAQGVDLDQEYSCTVVESNSISIKKGWATPRALPLRTIAGSGVLLLKGRTPDEKGVIDFYGPLTAYDLHVENSGALAFAKNPTELHEVYGSVTVTPKGNQVELDALVIETTRAFSRKDGSLVFLNRGIPDAYKLICNP